MFTQINLLNHRTESNAGSLCRHLNYIQIGYSTEIS